MAIGDRLVLLRKKRNPLKDFIFTDGTIIKCSREKDEVNIVFKDYCYASVQIKFLGVTKLAVDAPIENVEVMDAKFEMCDENWVAYLKDDDGLTVFKIVYSDVQIHYEDSNGD